MWNGKRCFYILLMDIFLVTVSSQSLIEAESTTCQPGYWRNEILLKCIPCECYKLDSLGDECNNKCACNCQPGIGGRLCNASKWEYVGNMPINCTSCGKCFDAIDYKLNGINNRTNSIRNGVSNLEGELRNLDLNITEIKIEELKDMNINDIKYIHEQLEKMMDHDNLNITKYETSIKQLEDNITHVSDEVAHLRTVNDSLSKLRIIKENTSILFNQNHTEEASKCHERIQKLLTMKNELPNINRSILNHTSMLKQSNNLICDGFSYPCDSVCGGGSCNFCGNSTSCKNGGQQQSLSAATFASEAELELKKLDKDKETLPELNMVDINNLGEKARKMKESYEAIIHNYKSKTFANVTEMKNFRNRTEPILGIHIKEAKPDLITKLEYIKAYLPKWENVQELQNITEKIMNTTLDLRKIFDETTSNNISDVSKFFEILDRLSSLKNKFEKKREEVELFSEQYKNIFERLNRIGKPIKNGYVTNLEDLDKKLRKLFSEIEESNNIVEERRCP